MTSYTLEYEDGTDVPAVGRRMLCGALPRVGDLIHIAGEAGDLEVKRVDHYASLQLTDTFAVRTVVVVEAA